LWSWRHPIDVSSRLIEETGSRQGASSRDIFWNLAYWLTIPSMIEMNAS
jgi:hypothetical protein